VIPAVHTKFVDRQTRHQLRLFHTVAGSARMPLRRWWVVLGAILSAALSGAADLVAQDPIPTSPSTVVRQAYDAMNRHDTEALLALYVDTVRYGALQDTAVAARSSTAELREYLVSYYAKDPHAQATIVREIAVGSFVVDHQRLDGTADGKPYEILDVSEVRNGRVMSELETANLALTPASIRAAAAATARRADDAFGRGDARAAAVFFADPVLFHQLGDTLVQRVTRAQAVEMFDATVAKNPHMRYTVVQRITVGPFVVDHERLTGMADGKDRDAVDILEIHGGQVVAEWESRF
jgi:hypothetical protein